MEITRGKIACAQKIVVYGPEGIGKSTFAAQFPDSIFIDTEGSTKHMDVARLPKPTSWQMLINEVCEVRDHPNLCKTLVVDTADWAEILCTTAVCSRAKKSSIEDFGYGKGFTYLVEEFGKLLNLLNEVIDQGVHVLLTAHAKMRKFEQPDEMGAYDRWEMKLSKNVAPLIKEWADMVLFANYKVFTIKTEDKKTKAQGGERVMYTAHHPCWDAKNRHSLAPELPFSFEQIAAHLGGMQCATTSVLLGKVLDTPKQAIPASQSFVPDVTEPPASAPTDPPAKITVGAFKEEIPSGVPQALIDLMLANEVTPSEIQDAVHQKGYYPADMPINDYPMEFVSGVLIGAWDAVFKFIEKDRKNIPFK